MSKLPSFRASRRLALAFTLALLPVLPALAQAEKPEGPNILFCIADDATWKHFGAYGCNWVKTPGFDRVAREGLLFHRAYTPNAKCAPSRACILTGRNSWQLKEAANHMPYFPLEFKTYVEALGRHGYFTGLVMKGWAPGEATDADGKPRHLAGPPFNKHKAPSPAQGISNNDYAANFEDFLSQKPGGQPFCFWYGCVEPHRAYEYGAGIAKGGKQISDIDEVPAFWPDNETIRTDMLDYAFEIEHFDSHLVRMLDTLEKRGELDNTLVVVTADNGMPFPRVKGQEYEYSNHLPLAIMWPKGIRNPGRKIDDFVSFIDLAPTFLEVAGLPWEGSGMASLTGKSLTGIFSAETGGQVEPDRDHVLIGKERHDVGRPHDWGYPIRGIIKDGMLYLHNFETDRWPAGAPATGYLNVDASPTKTEILEMRRSGENKTFWQQSFGMKPTEELYDISSDPECVTNLAADPAHAQTRAALKEQLFSELTAQEDPRMNGEGEIFDNYPVSNKAIANYYECYIEQGEKVKAGWADPSDYEEQPFNP